MALCVLFQPFAHKTHVFTVDHKLRPESTQEAKSVHRIVTKMGFKHTILSVAWPDHQYPQTSFELSARKQRYTLLTHACIEKNIRALFLAHHMDDQAETILMRLIEKSGPDGLAGMQKIAPNPMTGSIMDAEKLILCRPFLNTPKVFLKSICENHGIPWFEDPSNALTHFSKRNAIRKLFQKPDQLPKALQPSNMLKVANIMGMKRIKTTEKAQDLLSRTHITFLEATGSLDISCNTNICKESTETLFKWIAHFISLISPLPKQRKTVIWRIVIDIFTRNSVKTKHYTVGGILIHVIYHSQLLCMKLTRQPYIKSIKEFPIIFVESSSFLNPQNTWMLWDGRWWIRILSKNNIIKQFKIRPLMMSDMKQLYTLIHTADTYYKKKMLYSLKTIKGYTKFTVPLVESEINIIGLPTLGIIFDESVTIETKFKVDISTQLYNIKV